MKYLFYNLIKKNNVIPKYKMPNCLISNKYLETK